MCGRFAQFSRIPEAKEKIRKRYKLRSPFEIKANNNIAPYSPAAVIILAGNELELKYFRWSLIPRWAKTDKLKFATHNARAETAHSKASFRDAFKYRRCLVPASHYYEWQKIEGQKKKQAYKICAAEDTTLSLAGIWEEWLSDDGKSLRTFSIITCEANASVVNIHHRMPFTLGQQEQETWLNDDAKNAKSLLTNIPQTKLSATEFFF